MPTKPIDYQAHNFKFYTVHESNSDNNGDDEEDENVMILSSSSSGSSSSTLAPASSVEDWKETVAAATPSWGYFVPLRPYCYFSPPVQRRRR